MSAIDGLFTVNDVVDAAAKKSGVKGLGQVLDGGDVLDIQNDLSDMLAQWNVKTWLTWDKVDLSFVADGRFLTPYTLGPGGNFNCTPRTDRVEAAYIRILNTSGGIPVDQPIGVIPSYEEYSRTALKRLVSFPKSVFLDTAMPLGNVWFYPMPTSAIYEMHLILKNTFPLVLPLATSLTGLPPECRAAMKFCLAKRVRQGFGKGLRPDPELNKLAKDALDTMRNSHIQVPELIMPSAVVGRSRYNIYSDQPYAIAVAAVALSSIMWHVFHLGGLFT